MTKVEWNLFAQGTVDDQSETYKRTPEHLAELKEAGVDIIMYIKQTCVICKQDTWVKYGQPPICKNHIP